MLTRLRFKNWRSLKDVEINDLTPITVFIGANSSGKTNIIDGLKFLQESTEDGLLRAVQNRGGTEKIHTIGIDIKLPIEIEISFKSTILNSEFSYTLGLEHNVVVPNVSERLVNHVGNVFLDAPYEDKVQIYNHSEGKLITLPEAPFGWEETVLSVYGSVPAYPEIYQAFQFITKRWQLLDENFMPPLSTPLGSSGDLTVIDRCADNLPRMLHFIANVEPEINSQLQEDLHWLVEHVERLETQSDEHETRFLIQEAQHEGQEAPTISAGTARLVAILVAYYALDVRQRAKMPGLVVVEEPDTALNPGIHRNFVEQLRNYTSREGYPRQFILTTHNPHFLNFFKPEEVRVVERDEQGYTHVKTIDENISNIWLDEYGLGEVWTTNAFGGLPE